MQSSRPIRSVSTVFERLEQRALLSGAPPTAVEQLNFGGRDVARYTDPAGHDVVVKLNGPGTGILTVGPAQSDFSLQVDGTTTASTLSFMTAATTLGPVTVNGSLKAVSAKGATLAGLFKVTGTLGSASFGGSAVGSKLLIGTAGVATKVNVIHANDFSLTSAGDIQSLAADGFANTDTQIDLIQAASIGSIKCKGDMASALSVAGTLGSAKVGGDTRGFWDVGGAAGTVATGTAGSAWIASIHGGVGTLSLGSGGPSLTLGPVAKFKVARDLTSAQITVAGSVKLFSVGGALDSSTIKVSNTVDAATLGSAVNSNFFVGIAQATTALPSSVTQFVIEGSTLGTFTVKRGPFTSTNVAASHINKATVHGLNENNASVPFGFATEVLGSISAGSLKWKSGQDPAQLVAQGDFVVRLVTPPM